MSFNLGTASGRIVIDGSGAKRGFAVAQTAADAFFSSVQSRVDSVRDLGTRLTQVGAAGTAGLGIAVRAAANFEQSLSGVKAVSGATEKEMDQLRATALRIGKDTSFSATQAADALQELVKAGVSTEDILSGAADATVNLAAAGQIDLPRAAEIASSAINNFALSGKELPHVADLIAGAANASAIDVGDFGYSLSQAGAVANLTGLKFDDLAVAIAEMGQAGIKGSDAGTSIKTFLTNLIPTTTQQKNLFEELGLITVNLSGDFSKLGKAGLAPASKSFDDVTASLERYVEKTGGSKVGTKENAKAAQALGKDMGVLRNAFFDAKGDMEDFQTIQQRLAEATKGLTKEQKLSTLNTLFGSDAIRASAVFADQGAAGFDKMSKAIGKVSAADVAKTRLDNLNGSIEQFKGSLETAQIIIGEVFLPIIKKFVDGLTGLINIFNNLPEPVQKTIAVMIGLGSVFSLFTGLAIKLLFVLGPMLARFLGFQALKSIFSIFITGFKVFRSGAGIAASLSAVMGRAGVVFTRFAKIGKVLFTVLTKFPRLLAVLRTAATFAFGPWGIAIAAVAIALVILYKKFQPFHDLVNQVAKAIKNGLIVALDAVKGAWQDVVDGFRNGASESGLVGFFQQLGSIASVLYAGLVDLGNTIMQKVVPALKEAGGSILQMLVKSWGILSDMFIANVLPALRQLGESFVSLLPSLKLLWTQLQPVVKFFGILAAIIVGTVLVALYALIKLFLLLLPVLIKVAEFIIKVFIANLVLLAATLVAVVSAIVTFASQIVKSMSGAINGVAQAIGGIVNVVKGVFGLIIAIMTGNWKKAWESVKQIVVGYKEIIVGLMKSLGNILLGIVKGFCLGIVNFFKALYNTLVGHSIIPDLVNAIIRWIKSLPGKAASALAGFGSAVTGRLRDGMSRGYAAVRDYAGRLIGYIKDIPSRIRGALGNTGSILYRAGQSIVSGLINGIRSMIGQVRAQLGQLTSLIPDWKGPMEKDKVLLKDNGIAIIQSLIDSFKSQYPLVKKTLQDLTASIPDSVNMTAVAGRQSSVTPTTLNRNRGAIQSTVGTNAQTVVNNHWNVYNPVAEKTSITTTKQATRRAALGVLG